MTSRHVLVVGAGITGLATSWALTRAGDRVTVFERGNIPHDGGTSYDQHRLTRHAYGEQAGYTRMMRDADAAWDLLWDDLGRRYYANTGFLALSTQPGDWTDRSARTLDKLGIGYEHLSPGQTADRFPVIRTQDAMFGLYMAHGGVLFADLIMNGLAEWLRARQVTLRPREIVISLDPERASITTADGRTHRGDAIVVAAGAWTPDLFPDLVGAVTPIRQVVAYVEPPPALAQAWRAAPIMMDLGGPRGMYLAPPVDGRGFKIGVGANNRPCPLDLDAPATLAEGDVLLECYRDRFTDWAGFRVVAVKMCRYAAEKDQRFILQHRGRCWIATGCSGHGFKFGALMGLALTQAVQERYEPERIVRWASGEPDGVEFLSHAS